MRSIDAATLWVRYRRCLIYFQCCLRRIDVGVGADSLFLILERLLFIAARWATARDWHHCPLVRLSRSVPAGLGATARRRILAAPRRWHTGCVWRVAANKEGMRPRRSFCGRRQVATPDHTDETGYNSRVVQYDGRLERHAVADPYARVASLVGRRRMRVVRVRRDKRITLPFPRCFAAALLQGDASSSYVFSDT